MPLGQDSPFHPLDEDRILIETDSCIGFYDAYPVSRGHALVVPLWPVLSIYELDGDLQAAVWQTVRLVRDLLVERHQPDGFNIGVNDGKAAGQTVPHAHIHIIPRYNGDVGDPRGGIRWAVPEKAKYWK